MEQSAASCKAHGAPLGIAISYDHTFRRPGNESCRRFFKSWKKSTKSQRV